MAKCEFQNVEEYIVSFDQETAAKLSRLRELIMQCVPDVEEKLAWGAPTYYHNGYLLQFAGNKKHIGFYVTPTVLTSFKEELQGYKTNEKNTLQLPLDQPLPEELLCKIIHCRLKEHIEEQQ